jgi:hypothetical protein
MLPYFLYKQIITQRFRIFAVSHFYLFFAVFQADVVRYIYFNYSSQFLIFSIKLYAVISIRRGTRAA